MSPQGIMSPQWQWGILPCLHKVVKMNVQTNTQKQKQANKQTNKQTKQNNPPPPHTQSDR